MRPPRSSGSHTSPAREVVTTFSTPSGRPASLRIPARARPASGVCGAGLRIIVQPAAMAGPILRVPMASGKFQGVISRQGPTGRRESSMRLRPSGRVPQPPSMRTASSENQRKNSAAYATSPLASASGLPISEVIRWASSSVRSRMSS